MGLTGTEIYITDRSFPQDPLYFGRTCVMASGCLNLCHLISINDSITLFYGLSYYLLSSVCFILNEVLFINYLITVTVLDLSEVITTHLPLWLFCWQTNSANKRTQDSCNSYVTSRAMYCVSTGVKIQWNHHSESLISLTKPISKDITEENCGEKDLKQRCGYFFPFPVWATWKSNLKSL